MNYIRDIVYRLRQGQSEREIARYVGISRPTVHKYRMMAEKEGYLEQERGSAEIEQIAEVLGATPYPPREPSSLGPYFNPKTGRVRTAQVKTAL